MMPNSTLTEHDLAQIIRDFPESPLGSDPDEIDVRATSACEPGQVFIIDRQLIQAYQVDFIHAGGYPVTPGMSPHEVHPRYRIVCNPADAGKLEGVLREWRGDELRVEGTQVGM
jgi:hypothetical protein